MLGNYSLPEKEFGVESKDFPLEKGFQILFLEGYNWLGS